MLLTGTPRGLICLFFKALVFSASLLPGSILMAVMILGDVPTSLPTLLLPRLPWSWGGKGLVGVLGII